MTELIPTITPTPRLAIAIVIGKMKATAASSALPSWPMKWASTSPTDIIAATPMIIGEVCVTR